MRAAAALILALACAPAHAAAMPSQFRAEFEVLTAGVRIGHVVDTFVRQGDGYTLRSVSRSEGPLKIFIDEQITMESTGTVVQGNLRPLRFEQRRLNERARDVTATFDWQRNVLHSSYRGEKKQIALPPETQDRISLLYQLMRVNPRRGNMTIPMSNGRKVEVYTYRFVDEVRIATPAGEFDTVHLERVNTDPRDNKAEVWLAKDRFNFPVRVVFDDPKGLRLEQNLTALQAR